MEKNFDIVFNSEKDNGKSFQIANGHISQTKILFENEKIIAVVDAKGIATFKDIDNVVLGTCYITREESGKAVYESVMLKAEGDVITISFPVCEWIDNYPNCDGEHDRWDSRIIDYLDIRFDVKEQEVIMPK